MKNSLNVQKKLTGILLLLIFLLSIPCYLNTANPFLILKSNSMAPELPSRTIIVINNRHTDDIQSLKNKIIAYHDPTTNTVIVHRVIDVKEDYLITKGDSNPSKDAFQPRRENILGELMFKSTFFVR